MERELRLVIIDSDYGYIKQMEEALIRRFRSRAQIQIITDPAYLDVYFRTPRTIDILVADQSFYAEHLEEHTIHHILLLVPEVDIEKTFPDKVKAMMKYLPYEEILQAIDDFMTPEEEEEKEETASVEKPETKVVAVYSPIGGCGKSLTAMALGKKLKKLDQTVLLVGCDSLQSYSAYLRTEQCADEKLAEKLKNPGEDTYWTILQNIGQEEISCLLPFEKTMPALGIGTEEMKTLIAMLREKRDFAYVILDLGSELNGQTLALMEESDAYVLIMEANRVSNRKMWRLQKNIELLPKKECFMISNQYHMDGLRVPRQNLFGVIARYEDGEKAMEDPVFYRMALDLCKEI